MKHYYQGVAGWFDWEDVYEEAVRTAPRGATLVEVGCWEGKSLSFLCVEAVNANRDLRVVGVDHFRGNLNEGWMNDQARDYPIEQKCRDNCRRAGLPGFRLIAKPSVEAAREFADGSVHFVFIDGSHDGPSVKADLEAWRPKVAPGGWMAGHDWAYMGVNWAVREAFGDRVVPRPPSSWSVRL